MARLWYYYIYLLIVWGCFRYFVRLPEVIEELWFKPVIWLIPLFWWGVSMKEKINMFGKKGLSSILMGILVGIIYFVLVRKFDLVGLEINMDVFGVVLATAVTEELTFSGFLAGYLEKIQKGSWMNLVIIGVMVAVIKLPILLLVYKLGAPEVAGVMMFSGASGMINAWIRVKTGNVTGSILARMGMNLAVLG